MTLEERIRQLEDHQALADLVARYCQLVDDRDLEAAMDLFTDDAVFRYADDRVRLQGRSAIRMYFAERLASMRVTFHYAHGHQVEWLDGDRATGIVSAHAEHGLGGETVVAAMRYHDTYARDAGRWRFVERALHFYYFTPVREYARIMSESMRFTWPGPARAAHIPEMLETWRAFAGTPVGSSGV